MTAENPRISKEVIIELTDEETFIKMFQNLKILIERQNYPAPTNDRYAIEQANLEDRPVTLENFQKTIEKSLPEVLLQTFGFEALFAFVEAEICKQAEMAN